MGYRRRLTGYGNPKPAIRYIRRIIEDGQYKTPNEIAPGTKVYELVEALAKYLPENVRTNFWSKGYGSASLSSVKVGIR